MEDNEFEEVTIISHTPMEAANSHVESVAMKLIEQASLEVSQKLIDPAEIYMMLNKSPLYELQWNDHFLHFSLNEPLTIYNSEKSRLSFYCFLGHPGWHVQATNNKVFFRTSKQQLACLDCSWNESLVVKDYIADFEVNPTTEEITTLTSTGLVKKSCGQFLQIVAPPSSAFDLLKKLYSRNFLVTQYDEELYTSTIYLVTSDNLRLLSELELSRASRAKPGQLRLLAPKGGSELLLAKRGGTLLLLWTRNGHLGVAVEISVGLHVVGIAYEASGWTCWLGGKHLGCLQLKIRY